MAIGGAAALALGWHGHAAAADLGLLRYPRPSREFDDARWYPLVLLRAALKAGGAPHVLQPSRSVMVQSRTFRELATASGDVDVAWGMTNRERESLLLPVRWPLHKGLYGWRLLFVRPDRAEAFAQVQGREDLRRFRFGQAAHWPDTEVLRANGLPVLTTTHFESLFELLQAGRIDAFPRSVAEIWWELDRRADPLAVEPHLALHYPAPIYFFVHPRRTDVAQALLVGLRRLQAEGAFDALFQEHHGDALTRSRLAHRQVIELDHPSLPALTPLGERALWFAPQQVPR